MESPGRQIWRVFATYLAAIAGIFAASGIAVAALRGMYPDVPDEALLQTLDALLAGSLAASGALMLTILLLVQPADAAALRLLPGRETGSTLAIAVLGMLCLGQLLDSVTWIVGLGDRGSAAAVRRLLETAAGPSLFAAVVVFGPVAGAAEEIFFRGYMLGRLAEPWGPVRAVLASSACFAILHVDVYGIHVAQALIMGLYLGFVVVRTGSALPAIVCHVVNNVAFTLQTALGGTVQQRAMNILLAAGCAIVFIGCVRRLRRIDGPSPPP